MNPNLARRLYLVRPLAAALLCLPGVILTAWYAFDTIRSFKRYNRVANGDQTLTVEEFQLQLHDALSRDFRRARMPSRPMNPQIPRFSFHLNTDALARLYKGAKKESRRPYVWAELEDGNRLIRAEVRLRGSKHWHHLGPQKSLKIRLPKGKLVRGCRIFSLINDPAPMVVGESLILDLARQNGVLTPASSFARVYINGNDLGVFRFEAHHDESLLRNNQLVPGSIYSGNLPDSADTEELWRNTKRWAKPAWRVDEEENKYTELERLLENLSLMSTAAFLAFARWEMDLRAFATFDALDVAFGGDQHDFRQNHKLHRDPYKGKWEPIAWNFRGFKHDPYFNLVENPILLRLKMVPEFVSTRNRVLYELLVGDASVASIRSRGKELLLKHRQEFASDRFFDAYKMLPRIDRFHRQMVRPMNLERAVMVFESELMTYKRRQQFLLGEIQRNPLYGELHRGLKTQRRTFPFVTQFDVIVDGRAGATISAFRADWPEDCADPRWRVRTKKGAVTGISESTVARVNQPFSLYPTVGLVARGNANAKRGPVRSEMVPTSYSFIIESICTPTSIQATGTHLATAAVVHSRPAPQDVLARLPRSTLSTNQVPKFEAGEVFPHPGQLDQPPEESVRLGPGVVKVKETFVFGAHRTVEVMAGTRFRMAPNTSLVFLGRVVAKGDRENPIVIEGESDESWGGIAIQGPGTSRSVFEYVHITGGTRPSHRDVLYPGMINIHDTNDIRFTHCKIGGNRGSEDLFHGAYVDSLALTFTQFLSAFDDGLDLEFVTAALANIQVVGAGDDALDLMGVTATIRDSVLSAAKGNGISAGEQSEVTVIDTLVAASGVGVLAKNESTIDLGGALLLNNQTGVRVYRQTVRYKGGSRISADALFIVGSQETLRTDKASKNALDIYRVHHRLPTDGSLRHLLESVLGLQRWDQLGPYVSSLGEESTHE